jgi:hypothetical protein
MRPIHLQPSVQLGQPLAVYEPLENAAHLEPIGSAAKLAQEPHLHDTINVRIDSFQESDLVRGVGQDSRIISMISSRLKIRRVSPLPASNSTSFFRKSARRRLT